MKLSDVLCTCGAIVMGVVGVLVGVVLTVQIQGASVRITCSFANSLQTHRGLPQTEYYAEQSIRNAAPFLSASRARNYTRPVSKLALILAYLILQATAS